MPIPDQVDFNLSDVRIELGLPSTASLTDCFAEACAAGFNPTYQGSKDRLSNFRDYDHTPCTLSISASPQGLNVAASGGSPTSTITSVGDTWQYFSGKPTWISSISPTSGSAGGTTVTFNVTANNTGTNRNASMIFRLTNNTGITTSVSVFQFA